MTDEVPKDPYATNPYVGDRGQDELYIEPVVGFRYWRMNRGEKTSTRLGDGKVYTPRLRGVTHQYHWPFDGVVKAECKKKGDQIEGPHEAPEFHCQCGFYGYYDFATMLDKPAMFGRHTKIAMGIVLGWGRTTIHELGFRAQYARPIALLRTPDSWFRETEEKPEVLPWATFETEHIKYLEHLDLLDRIAEAYSIPVIDTAEASRFAQEHGTPIR